MKKKILIINGPNMNMLGIREPEIYGKESYLGLVKYIKAYCKGKNVKPYFYQSNHEGKIVDKIQKAYRRFDGIVIKPAAYTHTSVAIADAIKAVGIKTCEVHISDINQREDYRKTSFVSEACQMTITGHGKDGYCEACDFLIK